MRFSQQHLTKKIASYFLLLSLFSVGVVGSITFFNARNALQKAAFDRLKVASTLKEKEIIRWFDLQRKDFLFIIKFPGVRTELNTILDSQEPGPEYDKAYDFISKYFEKINRNKPHLQDISILNRSNRIIFSTKKKYEGKYELLANASDIEKVGQGNKFATLFYVSPETQKPIVTLTKTLRNSAEERQGIVLMNLNLERIDEIVRESTGLGKSGKTYLVGPLGKSKKTFIVKSQTSKQENTQDISSQGIDLALSGVSSSGEYKNYLGVPVLGEYRWLDDQGLALLVEISQQEAFAPARQLANTIMLISLASVGFLLIGVYWLSRQLSIYRQQSENYSHQLEAKAQEAETANHAKSEFLANMSHELRTPLNAILGFAQLMQRDKMLSSEQKSSLATINHSGEHLLSLINDILDMSKIEARRTVLYAECFKLHNLLQNIQEMFQLKAAAKGLFLQFDLDSNLPSCIIADEGKLRQVLINLLSNAIKFTDTGGVTLGVFFCSLHSCLYFEVEDTGKGIAPEEIEQIFDPFVQTASGIQTRCGTGLGLAISRQFVQLMGGDIYPTSTVKKGSTFSFDIEITLPETAAQTCQETKRVVKIAPYQPNYRILVVDDRLENRDLLAKLLNTVGFDTHTASNGVEAIDIWQVWEPHLIWMDMRMAVMDGYAATRHIKAKSGNRQTVIIALTASAFEEQQSEIFAAGCDDLVHKPFREEVIFEKMSQYLGVEYIYEEDSGEFEQKLTINSPIDLRVEELHVMPPQWIAQLHQAALEVDADLVLQIIEQIPSQYQTLAQKLTQLTLQYDFDAIIESSTVGEK